MARAMVPDGEANKILIAAWGLDCVDLNDKCKETIRWFGIFESIARCGEIPPRQRWCVRWELEKQCCSWCGAVGASDIGRKKEGGWRWLKGVKFAFFWGEPGETPMKIDTVHICTYRYHDVDTIAVVRNTFYGRILHYVLKNWVPDSGAGYLLQLNLRTWPQHQAWQSQKLNVWGTFMPIAASPSVVSGKKICNMAMGCALSAWRKNGFQRHGSTRPTFCPALWTRWFHDGSCYISMQILWDMGRSNTTDVETCWTRSHEAATFVQIPYHCWHTPTSQPLFTFLALKLNDMWWWCIYIIWYVLTVSICNLIESKTCVYCTG